MERLLDIKDAARFLNVSEMTIRRWTNCGKLKCYRVGGKRERRFYARDLKELLHDSENRRLKTLGIGGKMVPDGSHMTHFYTSKEEAFGVSIPYLVEGFNRGEALIAVMPTERSRELLENMERQGHPVGNWLKSGRLTLSEGMDSPEEMIRYLVGVAVKTHEFRLLGDMLWTVRKGWSLEALSVLEQSPRLMPPVENGLLLCQYSLEEFNGKAVMMAAEWHRQMIYKGRIEDSPLYALEGKKQYRSSAVAW